MATISYLTAIEFDFGAIAKTAEIASALGIMRPPVVPDPGIATGPLLARLREALKDHSHAVYDRTPQNPTEEAVAEAVALFKAECCDGVIALGGGSPIDLGKAVALMATHDGPLEQYAVIQGGLA